MDLMELRVSTGQELVTDLTPAIRERRVLLHFLAA
jgi:hypothetical protein